MSFLTLIAYNDDCVPRVTYSCVVFPTSPGVTYHIQVDGFNRQQGAVAVSLVLEAAGKSPSGTPSRTLTASPSPGFQRPPNDAFVDAGTKLPAVGSSVGASLEEGEPLAGDGAVGSVWYRFLAPSLPASVLRTVRRQEWLDRFPGCGWRSFAVGLARHRPSSGE